MAENIDNYINSLKLKPGISKSVISTFEAGIPFKLPKEYVDFLLKSNGAEGPIGNSYLALWSLEELARLNELYGVNEVAPGLFLFGSDGSDTAFAFDTRIETLPIVMVPFIGMSTKEVKSCSPTFFGFLKYLYFTK